MLNQQTAPGTAPLALDPVAVNGQMTPLNPQEMQHHLMHQKLMAALLMNRPQPGGMQGLSNAANEYTRAYMITKGNGNG